MSALDIVIIAVVVVLLILAVGGVIASRRRDAAREERLQSRLRQANQALADARASDRGWDRGTLEAAAQRAFGRQADVLRLVQVVDKPGTDEDEAVFQAVTGSQITEIRLRRTGDSWDAA